MVSRDRMLQARAQRIQRWNMRIEWLGEQVAGNIRFGMAQRLKVTAQLLRDRVVINIGIPVVKQVLTRTMRSSLTGRTVRRRVTRVDPTSRSRPGQYPRADTTRLMKDIFWEMRDQENEQELIARVGTTLDYGMYLEMRMRRSFLRRTLYTSANDLLVLLVTDAGGELPGQEMQSMFNAHDDGEDGEGGPPGPGAQPQPPPPSDPGITFL